MRTNVIEVLPPALHERTCLELQLPSMTLNGCFGLRIQPVDDLGYGIWQVRPPVMKPGTSGRRLD